MDLIQQGIAKGLIAISEDGKNITYLQQNKKYRYADPEEQIRAENYCSLVINYGYPAKRVDFEIRVPRRTPNDLADIVVYENDELTAPYIVVECKKPDISEAEFTQAIEQGFGNANSIKAQFLWVTEGAKENFYNVAAYPSMERKENIIADLPHYGQKTVSDYKYVKGGKGGFEIEVLTEKELTLLFKKAHDALWDGGKRDPQPAFDELDKLIFCKIWDERKVRKIGEPYDFQIYTSDKGTDKLLERIKAIYEEGRAKDAEVFKEDIRLTTHELQTVVGYLAPINLNKTDLDCKGRAFETFMSNFFRGPFGQYFTPRPIVKFIIECLPITNKSFVLDTSCGSGGFLLYALDKVRNTSNQMAKEGYFEHDSHEHWKYWHDFAEHQLFGIEISEAIARTAKMNMIIHDDGHTNVISFNGLKNPQQMAQATNRLGFKKDGFDFIATNPPFGSTIKNTAVDFMADYELGLKEVDKLDAKLKNINLNQRNPRDNQSSEVLFIEQCHHFLKTGGILAMVIPDGILTNSSSQYVRDWIEEHYRIIAVISMPQTAFMATGAGVKSSVIFLRKYSDSQTVQIRKLKSLLFDTLFEDDRFGLEIERLEKEKARRVKKGDTVCQQIEDDLKNFLAALDHQKTLTPAIQKQEEKTAKEQRKIHEKTEAFLIWKKELSDEYSEKIKAVKEALEDEFIAQVKQQLTDYPIFMAIAEDIGYDATGRDTGNNELDQIAPELGRFIQAVIAGQDSFFL
jgi:type I restriction enzyme M protein